MRRLYQLQARLGLSRPEGTAAVAVVLALLAGVGARHAQQSAAPLPPDVYAAADAAFVAAAADSALGAPAEPAPFALAAQPAEAPAETAPDSSAAAIADAAVERAAAPRRSRKPPPAPTNINTASVAELQRLPRIGPALAARIVEHRRVHGPFRHPDHITEVRGIGPKTLERLRPWIHL